MKFYLANTVFLLASAIFILSTSVHCQKGIEKRDFIPEDDSSYNRDDITPILINDDEPGFDSSDDENTAVKSDFENNSSESLDFIDNNSNEDSQEPQESGSSGSGSGETELKRETIADDDSDNEQAPTIETESGSDESGSGSLPDDASPKEEIEEASGSGSGAALPSVESEKLQTTATKNQPDTHYDGSVYKRNKIPEPPASATTTSNKNKRQYISRPRFVIRDGYVYMKAPPMTQKTIVTTHIPRPPMVMPYNTFMHRYRNGMPVGMAGMAGMGGMPFQGMTSLEAYLELFICFGL